MQSRGRADLVSRLVHGTSNKIIWWQTSEFLHFTCVNSWKAESVHMFTIANTTVDTALGQCNSLPIFNLRYILIIIPANGTSIMVRWFMMKALSKLQNFQYAFQWTCAFCPMHLHIPPFQCTCALCPMHLHIPPFTLFPTSTLPDQNLYASFSPTQGNLWYLVRCLNRK